MTRNEWLAVQWTFGGLWLTVGHTVTEVWLQFITGFLGGAWITLALIVTYRGWRQKRRMRT